MSTMTYCLRPVSLGDHVEGFTHIITPWPHTFEPQQLADICEIVKAHPAVTVCATRPAQGVECVVLALNFAPREFSVRRQALREIILRLQRIGLRAS